MQSQFGMNSTAILSWSVRHSLVAILAIASGSVAAGAAGPVRMVRDPKDAHTIVGQASIAAPAPAVWARLARVGDWRQLFPDIRRLEVKEQRGTFWRIGLDSAIFDCGPHDYEVRLGPGPTVDLRILAPGVEAAGQIVLSARGDTTVATYRLRVRASRIVSWFVSEAKLRDKQERLVEDYLAALVRGFAVGGGAATAAR